MQEKLKFFMPTQINFVNNTNDAITFTPIYSSISNFNSFVLTPGERIQKYMSIPGVDNYDWEWSAFIDKAAPEEDVIIGKFRADNPWYGAPYFESLSDDNFYLKQLSGDEATYDGITYPAAYWPWEKVRPKVGERVKFGKINKEGLVSREIYFSTNKMYYSTSSTPSFIPGQQFANVSYLGEGLHDRKTWEFILEVAGAAH
jgi:hypothetical protein